MMVMRRAEPSVVGKWDVKTTRFKAEMSLFPFLPSLSLSPQSFSLVSALPLSQASATAAFSTEPWILHDVSSPIFLRLFGEPATWLEAEQICQAHFGHLVRGQSIQLLPVRTERFDLLEHSIRFGGEMASDATWCAMLSVHQ